jgi:hypothetical protein
MASAWHLWKETSGLLQLFSSSLRFAGYGVEYCSAEEVSHLENGGLIEQDVKPSEESEKTNEGESHDSQDARLTSKQLNYLKRLARDRRMTDKELRTKTMEAFKKQPEYLSKKEASELIDQLLTKEAV